MTLKAYYKIHERQIRHLILSALAEDRVFSDVTTNHLLRGKNGDKNTTAVLLCKEQCILAGLDIFKLVFKILDKNAVFKGKYKDGDKLRNKVKVLEVKSSLKTLLTGERTALNFIQRMSGAATLTDKFVKKLKFPGTKILHTRKTTPNFRVFEIGAVKTGGGDFHRQDLSFAIMIKDNHIESAGSITKALREMKNTKIKDNFKNRLEIEVKSLADINEVVKFGKGLVKIVMLDNFRENDIEKAASILKQNGFKIEISGGINLSNFSKKQRKGIDFYSIGALTHSYKSIDFSLEF
jgi:nicotinate-nucleotide pyrophosphorylase (carboxylating)